MEAFDVFRSRDLIVTEGVSVGEYLSFADELKIDDSYQLGVFARTETVRVDRAEGLKTFRIREDSPVGGANNTIHLDSHVTFMSELGATHEALVLVEVSDDMVEEVYLVPFTELEPRLKYQLIAVDRAKATQRLGELANVSFAKGTHVTLAGGAQHLIEDLAVDDMILTRDHGPKPVRWVGHTTMRASGIYAPVVISARELHNLNDLVVSPEVCLFVYQRRDTLGTGRPEVMVKSGQLVNGRGIYRLYGGYIDYYQVLLDDHYVIYVEGIATESDRVDEHTLATVPPEVAAELSQLVHSERKTRYREYVVKENLLTDTDTVQLLRKASTS